MNGHALRAAAVAAIQMAAAVAHGQSYDIAVGEMTGPVRAAEIAAFARQAATLRPALSNDGNAWVQGSNRPMAISGEEFAAMIRVYRLTTADGGLGNPMLRDAIGRFCDVLLSARNDRAPPPFGGRRSPDGIVEPVWPNQLDGQTTSAGAEQGQIVGHLATCVLLYGRDANTIGIARGYLTAASETADYLRRKILAPRSDHRHFFRNTVANKPGEPVPWNQIAMIDFGQAALAQAYRIAAAHWPSPASVRRDRRRKAAELDRSVRANLRWFVSEAEKRGGTGRLDWGYQARSAASEDGDHAALDFAGLWRAWEAEHFDIREATMRRAAATFVDGMLSGPPLRVAGRVDGRTEPALLPTGQINKRTAAMPFVRSGYVMSVVWRPAAFPVLRASFLATFVDDRGQLAEQPAGSAGARMINGKPLALPTYAAMLDLRACLFGVDAAGMGGLLADRRPGCRRSVG